MNKKAVLAIIVALFMWQAPATAGEVDILVKKLVEHGVLSQKDAEEILQETRVEVEKERKETIAATREALMTGKDAPFMLASALPAWIKNTQFSGDMRVRYEYSNRENGTNDRNRGRFRFRLGFVTKINDKVDVGYGLASGPSDPRSTMQDFNNSFESKDIKIDYAYASYKPFDWLKFIGGKFQNPLWVPGDGFLWDADIRPEGVSAVVNRKVGGVEFFMTSGFWVLDEYKDSSQDPLMWVVQPGYKVSLGKNAYFKNALTVYQFSNVKGTVLDYSAKSNTLDADKNLKYDYDAVVLSGELGYQTGLALIPFAALYSEYVNNTSVSGDDSGYMCGFRFGHEKVAKKHQWMTSVKYQRLDRDAWLDIFPDTSAYSGATNAESYVLKVEYGLMDNISLGTNYFRSNSLTGSSDDENVVQAEITLKF